MISSATIANGIPAKKKKEADPVTPCSKTATVSWTASYFCAKSNSWLQQSSSSSCTSSSTVSCEDAESKASACAAALATSGKATALATMATFCNKPLD